MRPENKPDSWKSEVVAHFDEYAATYAGGYDRKAIFEYFFRRRQELVLSVLDRVRAGAVLDVGCGPGIYSGHCIQRGLSYVGLDMDAANVRAPDQARRRQFTLNSQDGTNRTPGRFVPARPARRNPGLIWSPSVF